MTGRGPAAASLAVLTVPKSTQPRSVTCTNDNNLSILRCATRRSWGSRYYQYRTSASAGAPAANPAGHPGTSPADA